MKLQAKLFLSMFGLAGVSVLIVALVACWQAGEGPNTTIARGEAMTTPSDHSVFPAEPRLGTAPDSPAAASSRATNSVAVWCAGVGGIVLLAVAVIAGLIARGVATPIALATAAANRIARGNYADRLRVDRDDEIGELTAAMDRMADNLAATAALATEIAGGNFTVDVELTSNEDQLGAALRTMISGLTLVLGKVNASVDQVALGAQHVADLSQALSQGGTEQASALEEIATALSQMAGQTKHNADNAGLANQLSTDARGSSEQGNSQMTQMVESMGAINEASVSISKIIKVIDEIAFQTNLLALNAAVEAARAGKHGKGFAVVAEEVRNLAARSAKAAQETTLLIEESVDRVKAGTGIAQRTAEALGEIFTNVTKTTDLVGEIAAASNEQAQGIAQVNQGLGQLEQVTHKNAADAEQGASAAEQLASQAVELRKLMSRFKLADRDVRPHQRVLPGPGSVSRSDAASPCAPCWEIKDCPVERRNACPAYPADGDNCWMVTGTMCKGELQGSYAEKLVNCKKCNVYQMYEEAAPCPVGVTGGGSGGPQHADPSGDRPRIALDDTEFGKY